MRIRPLFLVLPHLTLLVLAGCAGSQAGTREEAATTDTASHPQVMQAMAGVCPLAVQGTKVEAADTDTGAAMTFTTPGDVAELRRRVTAMADRHNAMSSGGHPRPHQAGQACECPSPAAGPGQGGSGCAGCEQHEGQACANCPMHGAGGPGMKKMGMHMPASRATTEEVPGGLRLVLTPVDATQLEPLRESVRHHAEQMSSGQCPMMRDAPRHHGG